MRLLVIFYSAICCAVLNNGNVYARIIGSRLIRDPNMCYPGKANPCCEGWTRHIRGGPCNKPVCDPPCMGGVCVSPNMCLCTDGSKAPTCDMYATTRMTCSDMGCSQQCYDTNGVVQCGCMRGFRLGIDAKTCLDIDECSIRNPCEQGCRNMQGRYMCVCYPGFTLQTDGRACRQLNDYSVTNCAGGKECVFPIDQGRTRQQKPTLPDRPQLGAVGGGPPNTAAATKAMPSVDEGSSRDWTDFQQWMATKQDSEPYPVEVDSEREPADGHEHDPMSSRFSEVNPFALPEGEPEVVGGAPITSEVLRPDSQQSAAPPSRRIISSSLQTSHTPSSGKVATGNTAYGPLKATLAFSQPELRQEQQSQVAFESKNYRNVQARLVFEDKPSNDQTARIHMSRTRGNRQDIPKVDVPRTFDPNSLEQGRKSSFGNTAYGPLQAQLQFTNPSQPNVGARPLGGYQQPPMNYGQGAIPQSQTGWGHGVLPQGGIPPHAQPQGGYFEQIPISMPQYGRPAVHWPQGRPFASGMPVYGGGFRVTAGGQPMINPAAFIPPPAWNGQYQVFNSRTPQYHRPAQPQSGYPIQTGVHSAGASGSFPVSDGNPEGWDTAALSQGGQPDVLIPTSDEPIQYFDHRGRPVDEPAVPSDILNPPSISGQTASAPINLHPAIGQLNQVYPQARQTSGYPVGACRGGACAQPAMQQSFGQPLSGGNSGPCLNDGCGTPPGGMSQHPFPGGAPCMDSGCGVGPGLPAAPFRVGEPCLNEGCGTGGGFAQPCTNGPCSGGTTIMQETIVDSPVSPCLGNGCMQSGGFPPQGFGAGAPMMNQPPCPAGQVWMVANTGYGSCQLMSSYQQQMIPGGCSPDSSVQCTVPGQSQPGQPQPGQPRPGLPQPGQPQRGQQPQPGQPGRRDAPLPGRVEFPRPGRAMGLPPANNAGQVVVDGAHAPVVTGRGGCVPECANGGTCMNGTCVCPPGVTGDMCQTDVNECDQLGDGYCEHSCANTFGSFQCICRPGATLNADGRSCSDITCLPDCLNGGTCSDGVCVCQAGFMGTACQSDINECEMKEGLCEAHCRNTFGSYVCLCPAGSRLNEDKRTCTNSTCAAECQNGGTCMNHDCICPPGFKGVACQLDVNECLDAWPCSQKCENTFGSFRCSCRDGLVLQADRSTCAQPKDEVGALTDRGDVSQLRQPKARKRNRRPARRRLTLRAKLPSKRDT